MGEARYAGTELALFARATRWKNYWYSLIEPVVQGQVLEVGAGLGVTLDVVSLDRVRRWVCLEPDSTLCVQAAERIERRQLGQICQVVTGTLGDLPEGETFDTILYLDVLEHIRDDIGEVRRAVARLRRGGALVVLGPAYPWLYTAFDRAIGHERRYTKGSLRRIIPEGLRQVFLGYLDSAGLLASAANRMLLRQAIPSASQIAFWDHLLVPLSVRLDPLLRYSVGKSVLGVWRRPGTDARA